MKTTLRTLLLVLALASFCYAETKQSCSEKDLKAIKANFDESYKNYKFISKTLNCYKDAAMQGDLKAISSVIGLNGIGQQNSEFTEWYAEVIEKLFIKSPSKFFDVLLTKDDETKDYVMARLINPLDGETDIIATAAKKIEKIPKYRKLIKQLKQQ